MTAFCFLLESPKMRHSETSYTLDDKLIDQTRKTALAQLYGAVSAL